MRAVLRYRRIPFRWVLRGSRWDDLPEVPVQIIPVIAFLGADGNTDGPDAEVMVDSSPQIMRLEAEYSGRSVVPADPALAFIDALIEDFADEWFTKAMYHYRWAYEPDIDKAGKILPLSQDLQVNTADAAAAYDMFTSRQIMRRALVGSTDTNQPIIEGSYRRVLDILQATFDERDFLLGDRPGRGDFGLFGQLTQLVGFDPTSTAVAVDRAPKVINWVDRVDDLSWLPVAGGADDGWLALEDTGTVVQEMLLEAGRTYTPFMLANAAALESAADEVVCEIDGREYRQGPFKYQRKCLGWLRDDYAALSGDDRGRVDAFLEGTGCEALFA
ncbi:MAG: glutathione S-transferase [Acidimicrobiaceae bacterium]|nr:glutathione S-transferase [Acidimicrobiaceae bacterium]MXW77284.1 glutathione S-transferase [Acidimicrobiaceae bacterium]MYA73181.1 glutathione S-transferase [Acidimicrobiaceae bacterium]MYC43492.1 glutathione S-transferase [Acidimicrobiaceae bacterium]MYD06544.1 glutathione S-transferase [Acidimicrobiaceae bacterium]